MTGAGRRAAAEFIGTALLLAVVVGSGVMADSLTDDGAIALLANAAATAAALPALIILFGPASGAHFNPAVTAALAARGEIAPLDAAAHVGAQFAGAVAGVMLAHAMFDMDLIGSSVRSRASIGQWLSELVATFGLVLTILGVGASRPAALPAVVGLYIGAAYWFTASTAFANPAATLARTLTDSFAGIRAADAPMFLLAQAAGAALGAGVARFVFPGRAQAPRQEQEARL